MSRSGENHKLKTDGFYKFLRHPSYFASLVSFVGFGISLNNWIALAIITTAIFTAFAYRIQVEEKVLGRIFRATICQL
ncbi:methyltransferase family protein [Flavobacterium noncentrifugens]|uniref:methyltransferase family protein n=1 Tax=Flavobacterium noncentrifugens TaxID=1128970 RepID=UPI000B8089EB